jgi:hypothetical protein
MSRGALRSSIGTKPPSSISHCEGDLGIKSGFALRQRTFYRHRRRGEISQFLFEPRRVHSGLNFPRIQKVNARIDPGLNQKIDIAVAIQRDESPRARESRSPFCVGRRLLKGCLVARLVRHGVAEPLEVRHLQLLFSYW